MRTVKSPEVRRQEIVDAATELFLGTSYDDATTGQVMKALGIAKGTIYHYFASKDDLLDAVVEQLADGYVERRETALAETADEDALTRLAVLFSPEHRSEEERAATERLHKPGNVKLHSRLLVAVVHRLAPVFASLVEQGRSEGAFRTEHPLEAAELLLAGVQFLTDEGFHPWDEEVLTRRMKALPALVESTLGADPGSITFL